MRFAFCKGLVFSLFIFCAGLAVAQDTASLNGRVSDPTGALVFNATVTAVKLETNQKFTATTHSSGEYFLPSLPAGHYNVYAEAEGFSKKIEQNVTVNVDATVTVNFSLLPGSAEASVTVNGDEVELETTSPTLDTHISARTIESLPMDTRDMLAFTTMIPGVFPIRNQNMGGDPEGSTGGGDFIVNGYRQSDNVVYFNGAMITQGNGSTTFLPNLDGVQEFTMYTALIPAKYGIAVGGQLVVTTKSGTNQLHGDIFEYYRNDAFAAINYFATSQTPYHRNDFGGTVGGPVYIPKLFNGHNKAWFFLSIDELRTLQYTSATATLPTDAMKQGIFTTAIKDPYTGTDYADNTILASDMSPIAQKFLQFFPEPNRSGTVNYVSPDSTLNTRTDQIMLKGDFQRASNDRWSGQYVYDKTPLLSSNAVARWSHASPLNSTVASVGNVHTFKGSIVNNAQLSYFRRLYNLANSSAANCTFAEGLGIADFPTATVDKCGVPLVAISGYATSGDDSEVGPVLPAVWWGSEQAALQKGKHLIEAGVSWRRQTNLYNVGQRVEFEFDGVYSGNAFEDFLLGLPYEVLTGGNSLQLNQRMNSTFIWAQDAWKIAPKLTISYGLRYESRNALLDKSGLSGNFDPATGEINPGLSSYTYPDGEQRFLANKPLTTFSHLSDFLPRFGFTYALNPGVVIRAGYSETSGEPTLGNMQGLGSNPRPGALRETITNNTKSPTFNFSDPFTAAGVTGVPNAYGMEEPFKVERSHEWALSVQNRMPFNSLLELSYVGSHTQNLIEQVSLNEVPPSSTPLTQANRPYPAYGTVIYTTSDGDAGFNGMGVKWQKNAGRDGLMLLSSFSWSKAMDNADSSITIASEGSERSHLVPLSQYRALSSGNQGLRYTGVVDYQLPFGYGRKFLTSGIASQIVGGWSFQVIETSFSGPWITVARTTNLNTGSTYSEHPDKVPGCNPMLPRSQRTLAHSFNTACFVAPPAYNYGNAGRSSAPGPGRSNVDLGIHRDFRLPKGESLQVRMEAFNAFNHGEFSAPGTTFASTPFGAISTAAYSRKVQFVGKWRF